MYYLVSNVRIPVANGWLMGRLIPSVLTNHLTTTRYIIYVRLPSVKSFLPTILYLFQYREYRQAGASYRSGAKVVQPPAVSAASLRGLWSNSEPVVPGWVTAAGALNSIRTLPFDLLLGSNRLTMAIPHSRGLVAQATGLQAMLPQGISLLCFNGLPANQETGFLHIRNLLSSEPYRLKQLRVNSGNQSKGRCLNYASL